MPVLAFDEDIYTYLSLSLRPTILVCVSTLNLVWKEAASSKAPVACDGQLRAYDYSLSKGSRKHAMLDCVAS